MGNKKKETRNYRQTRGRLTCGRWSSHALDFALTTFLPLAVLIGEQRGPPRNSMTVES